MVGVFCTYLPREIPHAMGASVVGLCSVTDETIPDAEKDLPRNLCPLIKSSYGFAKTDKCPFFYFFRPDSRRDYLRREKENVRDAG